MACVRCKYVRARVCASMDVLVCVCVCSHVFLCAGVCWGVHLGALGLCECRTCYRESSGKHG